MIEFFMSLLGDFIQLQKMTDEKVIRKSEAISKLKNAIRTTLKHIEDTNPEKYEKFDARFSDVESDVLAKQWSEAASSIRPFDAHLAKTLEDKSDYWKSPKGFVQDLRNNKRQANFEMNLDSVRRIADELEKNWK